MYKTMNTSTCDITVEIASDHDRVTRSFGVNSNCSKFHSDHRLGFLLQTVSMVSESSRAKQEPAYNK